MTDWSCSGAFSLMNPVCSTFLHKSFRKRLDYRLELFWGTFLYKSFMKRLDYRLDLVWSTLLFKCFQKATKRLNYQLELVWSIVPVKSFGNGLITDWSRSEALPPWRSFTKSYTKAWLQAGAGLWENAQLQIGSDQKKFLFTNRLDRRLEIPAVMLMLKTHICQRASKMRA